MGKEGRGPEGGERGHLNLYRAVVLNKTTVLKNMKKMLNMCRPGVTDTRVSHPQAFPFHFHCRFNCRGHDSSEGDSGCGRHLMSRCNPVLGGGVHTREQNSSDPGPRGMSGLTGQRGPDCGKGRDGKLQGAEIQKMREVGFKWRHWEGHFSKAGFKWRPEGGREVASGEWEEGPGF